MSICPKCTSGDHSTHQRNLGGICIGCACEWHPGPIASGLAQLFPDESQPLITGMLTLFGVEYACASDGHQIIAATGLTIRERGDSSKLFPHLIASTNARAGSIDFEALREWIQAYASCGLRAPSHAAPCVIGDYYIDARRLAPVLGHFKGPIALSRDPNTTFDPMMLVGEGWRFVLMGLSASDDVRRFAPRFGGG